jgi:hypothetical protein
MRGHSRNDAWKAPENPSLSQRRVVCNEAAMRRVRIGTSGWHYQSWRGPFFPKTLPKKDHTESY